MKVYLAGAVLSSLACAIAAHYVMEQRSAREGNTGAVIKFSWTTDPDDSAAATVVKHERAAFDAVKNKDKKTYADLMADEMTVISADEGMLDKTATLKSFDSETLSSYSLNDPKAIAVAPSVILLTYKLHIKTALAGKPHEGDFFVSSLWVNRDGEWKNVLYQ